MHGLRLLSPGAQREGAARIAALNQQLAAAREEHALLRSHVAKMEAEQAELAMAVHHELLAITPGLAEVKRLRAEDRAEVTSLLAVLRRARATKTSRNAGAAAAEIDDVDMAAFYEGFERRFRGTRESVQDKMRPYIDDVRHLRGGDMPLLDVGPGRCEWLELLQREGVPSYGVDVNPRFVEAGRELGLDVRHEDAITHLRSLPPQSLAGVTAFQVMEHLEPAALFDFVAQALRALRPGGLLIMETPNPLNVLVGSAQFWIDPSHVRPIHPEFLEYLCVNRGFDRVELRFANPSAEKSEAMDYAVVAVTPPASPVTTPAEPAAVESSAAKG